MPEPKPTTSLSEYYTMLEKADWTYAMSDDHSVWRRGDSAMSKLVSISRQSPEHLTMFNAMKEHYWSNPVMKDGVYMGREKPKPEKPTEDTPTTTTEPLKDRDADKDKTFRTGEKK